MYDFILQIIIIVSLAVLVYLVARVVPRISEMVVPTSQKNYLDELIKKIPLDKIDAFLNSLIAKVLRKAKIFVLKLDNLISGYLSKFKTKDNGKEALSRDILEKGEGEDQK